MKRFPVPADMLPLNRKISTKVRRMFKARGLKVRLVHERPQTQQPEMSIEMPEEKP